MDSVPGSWSWTEQTSLWRRWQWRSKTSISITLENVQENLQSKIETNINTDDFLNDYVSIRPACGDWRGTRTSVLTRMFRSEFTSSQYWTSWTRLNYLQKEGGTKKRCQYYVDPCHVHIILHFEQFKTTLEENTSIQHYKTTCCFRATSSSTSTTLEAYTIRTRSFNLDWFQVTTTSRKGDIRSSLRSWMQCSSIIIETRITTWQSRNFRYAQSNGFQFYQTRWNAIIFYSTLSALCIEKWWVMKSGEELHDKTYPSPTTAQRVALKSNLNYWCQDTTSFDARTSSDHSDKHIENCDDGTCKETCRGEMDFRIQGLSHSDVEEHDHFRKKAVKKWIRHFQKQSNQEVPREVLRQKRILNIQYFEICWINPNIQCPTVWHTDRKILCTARAEHTYVFQSKFENLTVTAMMYRQLTLFSIK